MEIIKLSFFTSRKKTTVATTSGGVYDAGRRASNSFDVEHVCVRERYRGRGGVGRILSPLLSFHKIMCCDYVLALLQKARAPSHVWRLDNMPCAQRLDGQNYGASMQFTPQ